MDIALIQIIAIVAGGVAIFAIARLSRKSHDRQYGKPSFKDKLRFASIFVCTLGFMLSAVVFFPMLAAILIAAIISCSYLGIIDEKPGVYRDVMYSATICSLISGFLGLVIHAR
ncbi:hypothetical protein HBA55_19115 [Pseudomaricurvus alkylphenolicus]|uniref:hypothetical protein n=1 Tax=Pseudomaricurvus alkylphenolicus TaxID=1306991 RepID=UPI00141F28A0|nr:hypothetical protein [Pseudomaricurvus alkylphenolicus]NIB41724.1 hypothetical protein [Pseudomaricurvus alkylphenolicus]